MEDPNFSFYNDNDEMGFDLPNELDEGMGTSFLINQNAREDISFGDDLNSDWLIESTKEKKREIKNGLYSLFSFEF